jgi:hypothetical protein
MGWVVMWNIQERGESITWFGCENMQERDSLEDLDTNGARDGFKRNGTG